MLEQPLKPLPFARPILGRWFAGWALFLLGVAGCEKPSPRPSETKHVPEVAVVHPAQTSLRWSVRQPGYVEAFEETAIVPKIAGYVEKWNVDIGDRVKKGGVLAVLWVPDIAKERDQKKAEVEQARKLLEVAEAHVTSTATLVAEAKAGVRRTQASLAYRKLQHDRVNQLLQRAVINKEVEDEALSELRAAEASVSEAEAKVAHAEADRKESEAVRDKTRVDIAVAIAALGKMQSLVDYATLTAPFEGVVSRRNINTGDLVLPPTASQKDALYVIQRRDLMRVFVEVPEADAVWVKDGSPARIRIPILKGREYVGTVRRMFVLPQTAIAHSARRDRSSQRRGPAAAGDVRIRDDRGPAGRRPDLAVHRRRYSGRRQRRLPGFLFRAGRRQAPADTGRSGGAATGGCRS